VIIVAIWRTPVRAIGFDLSNNLISFEFEDRTGIPDFERKILYINQFLQTFHVFIIEKFKNLISVLCFRLGMFENPQSSFKNK